MGQEDQALLQRYLKEEEQNAAQECLEKLLSEHAEPVVRDIAKYKFRSNSPSSGSAQEIQDEEDIRSEVVVQLIARLRDLRRSGAQSPIENFRGYVAATTYNAYYKYVRTKYPARWRLKNRLRYLLSHHRDFSIWKSESGEYVCGLAASRRDLAGPNITLENQRDLAEFASSLAPGQSPDQMSFAELVRKLLYWHGSPILLERLVGFVAEVLDIRDTQPMQGQLGHGEEDRGASVCELLPDPKVDIATSLEQRLFLERLWKEVCQLPQRQRVALLLNLRDASAGDALILFTLTGVASLRRIAEALEIPDKEFASLWNKLPLQDAEIAVFLGITRQQVINLRKSARERLMRRMVAT